MELVLSDLFGKHKISGVSFLDLSKRDGSLEAMTEEIRDGVACEIRAMEVAMHFINGVMEMYEEAQDIADTFFKSHENYRESIDGACGLIDEAKKSLKTASALFTHYPTITKSVDRLFKLISYYEAYAIITPMAGIRMEGYKTESVSTYFFKNPTTGLIKIGRSNDVKTRKQAVQCGSGVELDVLLVIDGDIERELHNKFSEYREHGEWFNDIDGKISAYIAKRN